VSMSDSGLIILPTHRLLSGIGDLSAEQIRKLLAQHFDTDIMGNGPDAGRSTWELIQADGGQDVLGFGTAADVAWHFARFKDPALIAEFAREHTPAWRSLAVSVLHKVVLEKLIPEAGLSQPKCAYVHSLKEVNDGLASRACQVAVLVPPARMA